ncbi:hypothetical protein PSCT_00877 [Pseudomonas sp. SCT]|nr:hypothetical protein PSCT_00877 [Pseudomonas sp. SCT]
MDVTVITLLIAIGSTLLVVATATLIGLVVARRLDSKNGRSTSDCPPPPRQHL